MTDFLAQIGRALDSEWGIIAVWFGSLWVVMVFIRKITKNIDDELELDKKNELAKRLVEIRKIDPEKWFFDFKIVFDGFFGENHFSIKCILRSSVISIFLYSVFSLLNPELYKIVTNDIDIISFVLLAFVLNSTQDYFSLLATRYLLNTRLPLVFKLILDAVLTLFIYFMWFSFLLFKLHDSNPSFLESIQVTFDWLMGANPGRQEAIARTVLLTSFSTSVWLWLHLISRFTTISLRASATISNWLNIEEKPVRAIGVITNMYLFFAGMLLFPVYYVLRT